MGRKFWNFRNSAEGEDRELVIDGAIAEDSWFEDDVAPKAFKDELNAGKGNITLWINSPGGDCFAASQIYTMLREYDGLVNVKVDGIAASAASVIAMAGDTIMMSPPAMLMIHNPSTLAYGDHNDMSKTIEVLDQVKESIINAYEEKTGKSREELSELMENETWMNARAAVEQGFADGIIGKKEECAEPSNFSQHRLDNRVAAMCNKAVIDNSLTVPADSAEDAVLHIANIPFATDAIVKIADDGKVEVNGEPVNVTKSEVISPERARLELYEQTI